MLIKVLGTREYAGDEGSLANRTLDAFNDTNVVIPNVCDPVNHCVEPFMCPVNHNETIKCSLGKGLTVK